MPHFNPLQREKKSKIHFLQSTESSPGPVSSRALLEHLAEPLRRSARHTTESRIKYLRIDHQVGQTQMDTYLEALLEILVQFENGSYVSTSVAVVWRRPDRHKCIVEHGFVSFHHQLVGSADQLDVIRLIEL